MFDLASQNAARSHRHHGRKHGKHRHNRAIEGSFKGEGGTKRIASYLSRKGAELILGGALGYMEGYSGEPVFFQTKGDATSGIGLKALSAILLNGTEAAQLYFGYSFSKLAGPLGGAILDGGISGGASASFVAYIFTQGNTYGAGKRSKEKAAGAAGVDYAKARRLNADTRVPAPTHGPERAPAAVHQQAQQAQIDPFYGY